MQNSQANIQCVHAKCTYMRAKEKKRNKETQHPLYARLFSNKVSVVGAHTHA